MHYYITPQQASLGRNEKNLLSAKIYSIAIDSQVNSVITASGLSKKFPVFNNLFKIAHKGEKGFFLLA